MPLVQRVRIDTSSDRRSSGRSYGGSSRGSYGRSSGGRDRDAGLIRSNQEYNKNGTTSITLNSGFVDEALNESFKQLMLSEEVELYDFNNDDTILCKCWIINR